MPELIDLLDAQAATTRAIVESASDADFARPTSGCPGWTVKDVVAHLTTGAQMFEGIARGTLSGANWMEERQRRLAENAALPPDELRRRFTEADTSLVATFKSLSPTDLQAKRQHPAFGEVPVSQFLGMRISETAVHGWDIQSAANPDVGLDAPAMDAVGAALTAAFPAWFLADKIFGLRTTYRFVVDGAERTLAIDQGKAAWTSGGSPDTTLTLDGGDFVLLISGRVSSQTLVDSGRAKTSGDKNAARQLSTLFRAYGGR